MRSRRPARAIRRLLAGLLMLALVLPLCRLVVCVDVTGQAVLELAHGGGDHHHDGGQHCDPGHESERPEGAAHHSHEADDAHDCHDQDFSSAFAPRLADKDHLVFQPACVRVAPSWPVAPAHHRIVRTARATRDRGPVDRHVITSVVALI